VGPGSCVSPPHRCGRCPLIPWEIEAWRSSVLGAFAPAPGRGKGASRMKRWTSGRC
jgi:hypothetical protein